MEHDVMESKRLQAKAVSAANVSRDGFAAGSFLAAAHDAQEASIEHRLLPMSRPRRHPRSAI
jgi:hypothetical protein